MRVVGLVTCCLLVTVRAGAVEPSCGGERPWVALQVQGEAFSPDFVGTLLGDLRAGLRDQGIDVCLPEHGTGAPVARVTLRAPPESPLRVGIDVADAVTDKRVGRDVDLARLPEDGRPFALAVATDELLRASWVELRLSRRQAPASESPPEVRRAVARALPEPAPQSSSETAPAVGVRLAMEHFTAGQTHFGLDALLRAPLSGALGLELAFGVRSALEVQAPHGSVSASALSAEGAAWVSVLSAQSIALDLFAGVRGLRVAFDASAESGALEHDGARWAVTTRGGVAVHIGGALSASLRAGAGLPLVAVEIAEGGHVLSGVAGLELFASTGLQVEF